LDAPDVNKPVHPDAWLASKLSALAAHQNQVIPQYRFHISDRADSGIELPVIDRLQLMWLGPFPKGRIVKIDPSEVTEEDAPLVYVDQAEGVGLVLGKTSEGLVVELDRPSPVVVSYPLPATASLYRFHNGLEVGQESAQRSAKDWFWFAIGKHKAVFAEAVLATFMLSLFGLMSALYTMQVYDRVVPSNGFDTLWVLTAGVLIAIGLEWSMKLVRAHMVNKTCKVIDIELSDVFFGKTLSIRADSRPRTVGTFAAQIRQFEQVRNFFTTAMLFLIADAPFALFFILVIGLIGGPIAWVPLIMIPISIAAGLLTQSPIERLTKISIEESNKKNGLLIEAIDGIESVKAAASDWKFARRWRELTLIISESDLKTQLLSNLATATTQSIQQLSYVGIIAVGAYEITQGNLTIGGLIACSIISGRALTPLAQIPNQIVQWKHSKIALTALDSIVALPDDRDGLDRPLAPRALSSSYTINDLRFSYDADVLALDVEHLKIRPGDRIALLGAVGSGKSTLLKLMAGLYQPKSGDLILGDLQLSQISLVRLREFVGWLPQDVRLFNGTLRDNLLMGLPLLSDEDILKAAALTGLAQLLSRTPRGLDIEISEGGKGLSGGQKQLVGLTRQLLLRPNVLLLDEPTASMDAALEARVMEHLFSELSEESTIVVATHKASVLKHVSRVIVLEAGKVLADGPRDQILRQLSQSPSREAQ